MTEEQNRSIEIFRELADKLEDRIFPIAQMPVGAIRNLLMGIYQGDSKWVEMKMKMLCHCMDRDDYEGCALFFYEITHMKDVAEFYSCKEKAAESFREKMLSTYSSNKYFTGKGVIYTVLTGNYETLKEPQFEDTRFDYICFTDDTNLQSAIWQIRHLEDMDNLGAQRLSRKPKILAHDFLGQYNYSIYVDSKFRIIGNLYEYITKYSMGAPMLCFPHGGRNCIYDEAEACIAYKKDDGRIVRRQVKQYRENGMPEHYGLIDAGCMARAHNNSDVIDVMNDWWKEFLGGCHRDQISFPYVCWRNNFKYDISDLFIWDNKYLTFDR